MSIVKNRIIYIFFIFLFFPLTISAIDVLNPLSTNNEFRLPNPIPCEDITCLIESVVNFISLIAFAAAPIMILIAAYYLIFSGGNPIKVSTAKKIIFNTAIGLFIILFSRAFVAIIQNIF